MHYITTITHYNNDSGLRPISPARDGEDDGKCVEY
jgi:hypothetical protein